ncbi:hypothetical protein C5167_001044 [Papaver somniferum]|uniref:Uncharacterized protein n=1 Tax=Papaver somniferum TaxID=3469 RepID=A0A4Y7KR74_PAPSO|nr:hypothetical protein C5167_001044 [Papaver somniferum]
MPEYFLAAPNCREDAIMWSSIRILHVLGLLSVKAMYDSFAVVYTNDAEIENQLGFVFQLGLSFAGQPAEHVLNQFRISNCKRLDLQSSWSHEVTCGMSSIVV